MIWKTTLTFLVTVFKILGDYTTNTKFIRFFVVVSLSLIGLLNIGNAQAQHVNVLAPIGGFVIDGNLQSNSPIAGDWVQGNSGTGGFVLTNHLFTRMKKYY